MTREIAIQLNILAAIRDDIAHTKAQCQTRGVKAQLCEIRASYYRNYHVLRNLRLAPWLYQ